jgi:hypothetical protein
MTILATHAYPKVGQILLGSVAEKILKTSSRLVLLVPPEFQVQPEALLEDKVEVANEEMAESPS